MARGVVLCLVAVPAVAVADPIVDRDYAIELHEGVAIGDAAQTAMGGAGAALSIGSAGALLNASAPAVRRTTDNERWSWDYHFDVLTARFSTDYDNNGQIADEGGAELLTLGLAGRLGNWAVAVTGTIQRAPIDNSNPALDATANRGKLVVARFFPGPDIAVGIGTHIVSFSLGPDQDNAPRFFEISAGSLVSGITWLPRNANFRAALALESKIVGGEVASDTCDVNDCEGYILPNTVESPARTILGIAYRWSETAWNQQVKAKWRDERSVTAVADFVLTGTSTNGNGVEAFAMRELQPSGRSFTASPRAGVEVEAIPGRLRLRGGSYWEPGRFEDVGGRLHGTFGFEVRVLEEYVYGLRRGKLGASADIASRYRNIALSIGFWH